MQAEDSATQLGATSKTVGSSMAQLLTAAAQVSFSPASTTQMFYAFLRPDTTVYTITGSLCRPSILFLF